MCHQKSAPPITVANPKTSLRCTQRQLPVATRPEKLPVTVVDFCHCTCQPPMKQRPFMKHIRTVCCLHPGNPWNLSNLPCADFQLDIVVVDLSRFPRDFVGPVVTDELGIYENSFARPLEMAPDVPVCEDCEIWTIGMWCKWKQNPRQQCQACVQDDYRSVFLPQISTVPASLVASKHDEDPTKSKELDRWVCTGYKNVQSTLY